MGTDFISGSYELPIIYFAPSTTALLPTIVILFCLKFLKFGYLTSMKYVRVAFFTFKCLLNFRYIFQCYCHLYGHNWCTVKLHTEQSLNTQKFVTKHRPWTRDKTTCLFSRKDQSSPKILRVNPENCTCQ